MNARVLKSPIVVDDQARERARDQADRHEQALADAYERGRADGGAEATDRLDTVVAELAAALDARAEQAIAELRASHALGAELIVELGEALAEWYLGAALPDVRSELAAALTAAAADLDQVELVVSLAPDTADVLDGVTQLTVRPDPSLGPADFRLSAAESSIERCWGEAVQRIRPALTSAIEEASRGAD